jgi:hypothetical protein
VRKVASDSSYEETTDV